MKSFIYLIIAIVAVTNLFSQNFPYYFDPTNQDAWESKSSFNSIENPDKGKYGHLLSAIQRKPYNVLKYELYMDWFDVLSAKGVSAADKVWRGSNKITVRIDSQNVSSVIFDAAGLKIQSVMCENIQITPVPQPVNGKLSVKLPYIYKVGDTIAVTVNYQYLSVTPDRGFYVYPEKLFMGKIPGTEDSSFVEERLAYTMAEPEDARFWMPCNDQPDDKAIAYISVRVPKDFIAASNGLIGKIDDMDSYKIYHWKDEAQITTYLMAVSASKYVTYSDWYKKVSNPLDSVEIQYYIWKKDFEATKTDQTQYNAHWLFEPTVKMMEIYSKYFVEYPFSKYGMVAVQPFNFGGMEHQTLTSINRVWMRTNQHFGSAHELAHQWLGDLITCATWKDIWINEGGATWSEGLWAEALWGNPSYFNHLYGKRRGYLQSGGLTLPPIYDLPVNTIFGKYATLVYEKASWVYHQLRVMLGDSVYFPALRNLMTQYAGKSLETQDFINHFVSEIESSPIDLNIFFDQWLMKAGHPVFETDIVYTKKGPDYNANITMTQTQSGTGVPDVFQLPVRFLFWGPQGITVMDTLICKSKIQNFNVLLPFMPDSVKIDETFSLLESTKILTGVKDNDDGNPLLKIYPNPAKDKLYISLIQKTGGDINIVLTNLLGERIKTLSASNLDFGGSTTLTINLSGVPSGLYLVEITGNGYKVTHQVVIVKD